MVRRAHTCTFQDNGALDSRHGVKLCHLVQKQHKTGCMRLQHSSSRSGAQHNAARSMQCAYREAFLWQLSARRMPAVYVCN